MEIADEYAFLSDELDFENDTAIGPNLAEDRASRITAALEGYGAVIEGEQEAPDARLKLATNAAKPILELLRADTAQSQDEWLDEQRKRGPLDPGSPFSQAV